MQKRYDFRRCAELAVAFPLFFACTSTTPATPVGGGDARGDAAPGSSGGANSGGNTGQAGAGTKGSGGAAGVGGGAARGSGGSPVVVRPPNPCALSTGCPPGVWVDVTPPGVSLSDGACGNFGTKTVQTDRTHPADAYTFYFCQGLWKSSDYGQTWTGPINTGGNGATITDCAGGISIAPVDPSTPPTLYASCIRGGAVGFWRSTDGGVSWATYNVDPAPPGAYGQQFYPALVDPYDGKHLLMAGHATDLLLQSSDGGATWSAVKTAPGMAQNGGTGGINFINTGDATTTHDTWLWLAATSGGKIGTWRTSNGGADWATVDTNEHTNGATQIFQPDTSGIVFMAGEGSKLGAGVLRSTDYGKTWTHVGGASPETIVFGTSKSVYSMYGWGPGAGQTVAPALEIGAQPATGSWTTPGTPPAMTQGPAQAALMSDGKNSIILVANYNAGLWRYVEP